MRRRIHTFMIYVHMHMYRYQMINWHTSISPLFAQDARRSVAISDVLSRNF